MAIDQIYQPFPREFQVLNNHVIYLYLPVFNPDCKFRQENVNTSLLTAARGRKK